MTKKYRYVELIDFERCDFVPFVLEIQGEIDDSAISFIEELTKRKKQRMAALPTGLKRENSIGIANLDIVLDMIQRANSERIIQRLPRDDILKLSEIRRCQLSATKVREEARRRIADRNLKEKDWYGGRLLVLRRRRRTLKTTTLSCQLSSRELFEKNPNITSPKSNEVVH